MSATELNQGAFDAALEISARRASVLREVKTLLEDDRDQEALKLMRDFLQVVKKAKTSRAKLVEFPRPAPEDCSHRTVEMYATKGRFAPPKRYWSCVECGVSFEPKGVAPDGSPFTREQHHELCIGVMAGCYPFVDATWKQAIREGIESAALLGIPVDCRNLEQGGPLFTGGNA